MENNAPNQNIEVRQENKKVSVSVVIGIVVALLLGVGAYFYMSSGKSNSDIEKTYKLSDISTNNTKESCWTVIDGSVYDLTDFISKHKGGDKILAVCGIDGTDLFTGKSPMGRVHSQIAVKLLGSMKIGQLQ